MSEPLLTEDERQELRFACQIIIQGYVQTWGVTHCGWFYSEATNWNEPLYLCSCDYPRWELRTVAHES